MNYMLFSIRLVIITFLSCLPFTLIAQYNTSENRVWAMGNKVGFDFNTEPPSLIATNLTTSEGCAAVSDSLGNLLFYSNGTNVWDAQGALFPNGASINGTTNSTNSTTQGCVIVPDPTNEQRFYIFSLTAVSNCRLFCNVVDMSLNNGQGDVDTAFYLRGHMIKGGLTEKMTSAPGCSKSAWLIVRNEKDTEYFSYRVDATGVDTVPVVSNVGGFLHNQYAQGVIKVSPSGKKILSCNFQSFGPSKGVEVYDFNRISGVISNAFVLDSVGVYYGGEFSPDESKVYAQSIETNTVYQFDLNADTPYLSKLPLGPSGQYTDLKLGPDDKIYFGAMVGSPGFNNYRYFGRINAPNLAGTACDFQDSVTTLAFADVSGTLAQGMPNTIIATSGIPDTAAVVVLDSVLCPNFDPFNIILPSSPVYLWSNGSTDSFIAINTPGIYWVYHETTGCPQVDTYNFESGIPEWNVLVEGDILSTSISFETYQWYNDGVLIEGATDSFYLTQENGLYTVRVTLNDCFDSLSYLVTNHTDIQKNSTAQPVFKVFPNPASDVINIDTDQHIKWSIYNLDGRVYIENETQKTINISSLSDGIYILQINDIKGSVLYKSKLVKISR